MSVISTEINCRVGIFSKGVIDFKYSLCEDSAPLVEYHTNCQDLLCLGRTAGRTYSFIPNRKGLYVDVVGKHVEEVLNPETMQALRDFAKDLPDKLREALGL